MSRDLVTELYEEAVLCGHHPERNGEPELYETAAAEIDNLHAENDRLRGHIKAASKVIAEKHAEIERLRSAVDAWVDRIADDPGLWGGDEDFALILLATSSKWKDRAEQLLRPSADPVNVPAQEAS